jgi:hypothetical protein
MIYKSQTPPLCRFCKRPIDKHTSRVYLREKVDPQYNKGVPSFIRYVEGIAHCRDDCKLYTNKQVVSLDYDRSHVPSRVHSFGEWDGESYIHPHFCTGNCAKQFAYAVAEIRWPSKETRE